MNFDLSIIIKNQSYENFKIILVFLSICFSVFFKTSLFVTIKFNSVTFELTESDFREMIMGKTEKKSESKEILNKSLEFEKDTFKIEIYFFTTIIHKNKTAFELTQTLFYFTETLFYFAKALFGENKTKK